jgi:hypothetical protein
MAVQTLETNAARKGLTPSSTKNEPYDEGLELFSKTTPYGEVR